MRPEETKNGKEHKVMKASRYVRNECQKKVRMSQKKENEGEARIEYKENYFLINRDQEIREGVQDISVKIPRLEM